MKIAILVILWVSALFSCSPLANAQGLITKDRLTDSDFAGDGLKVKPLDPQFSNFPDASLADFSFLLDAPAGKFGFVRVSDDGHFCFSTTNKRIRFFGVTIAASNVDVPHEKIDDVLDVLARAGCNLVRFHELDNRGGEKYNLLRRSLIDESFPNDSTSQHFDKEYFDRLDYWVAGAEKRGIYVYLVVRGYRTFKANDGIPGTNRMERKGSPYSLFDERMIELQLKYIDEFLFNHVNPYTKLPYALDPAVAMIELINEDSFFFQPNFWSGFMEPYRGELEGKWNGFLTGKYKSDTAFRNAYGTHILSGEKLGDIKFPDNRLASDPVLRWERRLRDAAEFAALLQADFYLKMKEAIRRRGCPIPLTATVNSLNKLDTYTVAQNLDFIGQNAYLDHPSFTPGEEWKGIPSFSNKNNLRENGPHSLQAYAAQYAWSGKPIVIREWATCWPNRYRVSSMLQIAAFGLLQDYDALIYFSYYTAGDVNEISSFGAQADPTQWGIFPYAAKLFISGDVEPIRNKFEFIYSKDQITTWEERSEAGFRLAFEGRVRIRADSGSADAIKIWTTHGDKVPKVQENSIVQIDTTSPAARTFLRGLGLGDEPADNTAIERIGFEPIYFNNSCAAFYAPRAKMAVLTSEKPADLVELAKLMSLRFGSNSRLLPPDSKAYVATSQVQFDTSNGAIFIRSPRFESAAGELATYKQYRLNVLAYTPSTGVSAFVATTLDNNPIQNSSKLIFKMATTAHNRGERLVRMKAGALEGRYALMNNGLYPIQTDGEPSVAPAIVARGSQEMLQAFLKNGTWEFMLEKELRTAYIFCDSRNIKFALDAEFIGVEEINVSRFYQEVGPDPPSVTRTSFIYPAYSKCLKLTWGE
jgi:hypothetical protein